MSHFLALALSNTDGIRVCLCHIATEINFSRFSGRQVQINLDYGASRLALILRGPRRAGPFPTVYGAI